MQIMFKLWVCVNKTCSPCRKQKHSSDVATCLLKTVPESCAVYVISKGRLRSVRFACQPLSVSIDTAVLKQKSLRPTVSKIGYDFSDPHQEIAR